MSEQNQNQSIRKPESSESWAEQNGGTIFGVVIIALLVVLSTLFWFANNT